jgi:hypothetical protein
MYVTVYSIKARTSMVRMHRIDMGIAISSRRVHPAADVHVLVVRPSEYDD